MLRSRMKKSLDKLALKFSSSMEHDEAIFYYDILVDIAHVLTLNKANYLSNEETKKILNALKTVRDSGFKEWEEYEDVHEAIEAEVTKITKAGLKMHTARSRNDEIATCLRMFARDGLLAIGEDLIKLKEVLLNIAESNHTIMPGFTHLQYAQPTRLSHHVLAYHEMIDRDFERVLRAISLVNKCPLGSAAFASSGYNIDRKYTAKILGFDDVIEHSEDAVSSRDFLIEVVYVCTSIMLSLSRIAEEIILWSSEFNFIRLPDEFSSTSSIMPQKKNPDIAELIRANAGRMIGNFTSVASIYKALPFSYNRDFQEMNSILYDSIDRARIAVEVFSSMLEKIEFNNDVIRERTEKGFLTATEIADMLVREFNIPFRIAHRIVGSLAMRGVFDPSVSDLKKEVEKFGYKIDIDERKLAEAKNVENIVEKRINIGGTSISEISRMIVKRKKKLEKDKRRLDQIKERVIKSIEMLYEETKKFGVDFYGRG